VSNTVEASNAGLIEHAEVRFDPTGSVTVAMGTHDHGQGHQTTFRQIISDKLGIDPSRIRFSYGDTDEVMIGTGTFGSRSTACGGSALLMAAEKVIAKGRRLAAHMMEAGESDIEFAQGRFVVAGTDKAPPSFPPGCRRGWSPACTRPAPSTAASAPTPTAAISPRWRSTKRPARSS
jgi:aerobic carbon-monoxide dehydrogenase large subunit